MFNLWKYDQLSEKWTFIRYLCEICSMCENIVIWVKIWLSLDIYVKYAHCVKISLFEWNFDFHWIFVWNMLNVWKYSNLSKNLTFIEYLCEICSMCKNIAIWVKIWLSLFICVKYAQYMKIWPFDSLCFVSQTLCSISEDLCSISDGHYWIWHLFCLWWKQKGDTCYNDESCIWSKGRHTLSRRLAS
jgi:hypothetical protein